MSGKKRLVDCNVFDCHNAFFALQIDDAINQQKWKPMRQDAANLVDVQRGFHQLWSLDFRVSSIGHTGVIKCNDYTVPLRTGILRC